MGIDSAGEIFFLEKIDYWCFRYYWWERMKTKTHKKLNITLPLDVYEWAVKKQKEEQKKTRLGKVHFSNIIADAVAEMKARDDESTPQPAGQAMPDLGKAMPLPHGGKSKIVTPSAGGYSTRKPKPSRKAG